MSEPGRRAIINEPRPRWSGGAWTGVFTRGVLTLAAKGSAFAATILVTRSMTTEGAGNFFYFLSLMGVLGLLLALGLSEAISRQVPMLDALDRTSEANDVMRTALHVGLAVGGLATLLVGLSAAAFFDGDKGLVLTAAFAAGTFLAVQTLGSAFLRARRRFLAAEIAQGLVPLFFFLALLIAGWVADVGSSTGIGIRVVLEALAGVAIALLVIRNVGPKGAGASLRLLLGTSLPLWITALSWLALQQSDVLLLGALKGAEEVGVYAPILKVADLAGLVFGILMPYVFPAVARLDALGERDTVELLSRTASKGVFAATITILTPFIVAPERVIDLLFGIQGDFVAPTARILVGAYCMSSIFGVNTVILEAIGRVRDLAVRSALALAGALLVNAILISRYGIKGAALGTLTSYSILVIVNGFLLFRSTRISLLHLDLGITVLVAAAALAVVLWVGFAERSIPGIVAAVILVGGVTSATAYATTPEAARTRFLRLRKDAPR